MVTRADILKYVDKHYHTKPEHLWEKYPTSEILRHERNRKWYALITDVSRNKVGLESDELIDILNVKCEPDLVFALSSQAGFSPAWHMNKKHWCTVQVNHIPDETLDELIKISFDITAPKNKKKLH